MPDFMRRRAAEVVPGQRPAGQRPAEDVAAVEDVDARRAGGRDARGGERAVAEQGAAGGDAGGAGRGLELRLVVDVEGAVGAFAEGGFHGLVGAVGGPGVVCRSVGALEGEADRGVGVRCGEVVELVGDHGVCDVVRG